MRTVFVSKFMNSKPWEELCLRPSIGFPSNSYWLFETGYFISELSCTVAHTFLWQPIPVYWASARWLEALFCCWNNYIVNFFCFEIIILLIFFRKLFSLLRILIAIFTEFLSVHLNGLYYADSLSNSQLVVKIGLSSTCKTTSQVTTSTTLLNKRCTSARDQHNCRLEVWYILYVKY